VRLGVVVLRGKKGKGDGGGYGGGGECSGGMGVR